MAKTPFASHARRGRWAAASLFCILTMTTVAANGGTPPQAESPVLTLIEAAELLRIDADELERLAVQQELPARRIGSSWRFNRATLMAWLNGDWELSGAALVRRPADLPSPGASKTRPPGSLLSLTAHDIAAVTARGTAIAQAAPTPAAKQQPPADGQGKPIGEAPEERKAEDIFLRGQRVLLRRGEVVADFGQFYSRSDNLQLASVDGRVGLATLEQTALTTLLFGRVGIFSETELFASTAFQRQRNHTFFGSASLGTSGRSEFGGVSVGVRHTFLRESVGRPDIVATFAAQIPTGDRAYGMSGGLVLVKSFDPVVMFASGNYRHSFSRDFSDVSRVEPRDGFDVSIGYGLALNDTLAISTAVSGFFNGSTTFNDVTSRRSDFFSLRFALTSLLAEGLYFEPSVTFGLGGPSDSFALGVTIPYSF